MSSGEIGAIAGAAVAIITALTGLIAQLRHNANPNAHQQQTPPGGAK